LEKLHKPASVEVVEEAADVCIQHKAHLLPRDRDVQRVQRLMLAASWPEAIGESPKVLFINLIEDRDHGMLDDFVLQRCDSQWPLPAIGLRNNHSPGWLRSVSAAVNPTVKINKPTLQPGFILVPGDAVHPRGGSTLQSVETFPQQLDCQMVEQGGEPHPLPF